MMIIKVILFLLWVNLLPAATKEICKERFKLPIDGGRLWFDHRPVFGTHKTVRGFIASLLGGLIFTKILGVPLWAAGSAALLAMAGDLLSSFIKRRFNIDEGTSVLGLDQLFESLFPALYLSLFLPLSLGKILVVVLCFMTIAHYGSSFWRYILYRPSIENYPRIIRSTVRLREWRACHQPLARWHTLLNLTSFLTNLVFLTWFFKLTGLYENGRQNALDIRLEEMTFRFPDLPETFDRFRILLLTDLHLDGLDDLTNELIHRLRHIEVDLCLIGGDIRMKTYGPIAPSLRCLRRLLPHIKTRHGILGVLGNHDCIEMTPDFEELGIIMLINDSWKIDKDEAHIRIIGVDDPHYYKADDAHQAFRNIPANDFKIFLAHSPEVYKAASSFQAQLYLCGHTHGGQMCLPDRGPILTNSRAPRFTASGRWQYQNMTGYTSRGVGVACVPLRFNCPGEISLITLRKEVESL